MLLCPVTCYILSFRFTSLLSVFNVSLGWETSFKPTQKNRYSYILHIFIFTILEAEEKTKYSDLNNSKLSPGYDVTKLKWILRSDISFWKWKSIVIYFSSVRVVWRTVSCVVRASMFQTPTRQTGQNTDATVMASLWETGHRVGVATTRWEIEQCVGVFTRDWTLCVATVTATRHDGFETALPFVARVDRGRTLRLLWNRH